MLSINGPLVSQSSSCEQQTASGGSNERKKGGLGALGQNCMRRDHFFTPF